MSNKKFVKNVKNHYSPMHTAEHIVTAVIVKKFENCTHFNSKVEKKKSKCDFTWTRNLTKDEINFINLEVNKIIQKDIEVKEEVIGIKDAKEKGFNVDKVKGDTVRIIKIGDIDAQPCSGHHVKTTKEIGNFKLTTSDFNKDKNVLRIRFKLPKKK